MPPAAGAAAASQTGARLAGTLVVHDLMQYGKELGGEESQRPGIVMMEQTVEAAKL